MARPAPRVLTIRPRAPEAPSYPVVVGSGALGEVGGVLEDLGRPAVAAICDASVAEFHGDALRGALAGAARLELYLVPPGEASKSPATFARLCGALAADGFDRSALVIAFGGGVVGDLAGFVAASVMRGVAFVNVPTSQLAMVDASVGGKTGVNLHEGKNLMGAFWQPRAVVADVDLLATLPERVFRQGAVESFKHGLLADGSLLELTRTPGFRAGGDPDTVADLVARSVAVKAEVVARDTDERGVRAHLNLGHTLAHALEKASGHALAHGDAVAYGLLYAAFLAEARGWDGGADAVRELLAWLEPDPLPELDWNALEPYVARDKKHRAGVRRWVLLEAPQRPTIVEDVTAEATRHAWDRLRDEVGGDAGPTTASTPEPTPGPSSRSASNSSSEGQKGTTP